MKARILLLTAVLSLFLPAMALGQRTLSSDEISLIFQHLTSQPRKTWIPAGTIQATHHEYVAAKVTDAAKVRDEIDKRIKEYQNTPDKPELTEELQKMKLDAIPFNVRFKLANEYTMDSQVTVRYDGERFYWAIDVDSRQDSVTPDSALAGNVMTEHFDLNFNRGRVFVWDGDKYAVYTASGKCATVDAAGRFPHPVNGPLTAGLIPWGHGRFSYVSLSAANVSATELNLGGATQIQMSLTWRDGWSMSVTVDPARDYAVTACTLPGANNSLWSNSYDGYRQVAGVWVPSAISLERRDALTDRLLASDLWNLTSVDSKAPTPDKFAIDYETDTVVQYDSPVTDEPSIYLYSNSADTDRLLADRLAYASGQGKKRQNCGTAAFNHVVSRLGKSISSNTLESLVGSDGRTTLLAMKQLALSLGLQCRAVQTDLAGLQSLSGARAILHIPGKNHFVVLDSIDDRYVRIIDLSDSRFYYSVAVDFFPMEWSQGVALLISTGPIAGQYSNLDDTVLAAITGTSGYSCTKLIQVGHYYLCIAGCQGYYTVYWERYGCGYADSGTCYNQPLIRYQESACIPDFIYDCTVTGEWILHYMWACK